MVMMSSSQTSHQDAADGASRLFVLFITAITISAALLVATSRRRYQVKASNVPPASHEDLPLLGARRFFSHRWDFMLAHGRASASQAFSFHIGNHHVVGLTGELNKKTYFETKALNLSEGYAILFGQTPSLERQGSEVANISKGVTTTKTSMSEFSDYFRDRLTALLHPKQVDLIYPQIINDVRVFVADCISKGSLIMDPFVTVDKLVSKMVLRAVGCNEIADDAALLDRCLGYFKLVEDSTTIATIITPWWMPIPSRLRRTWGGIKLYMIVGGITKARREGKSPRQNDCLQLLVDRGDSDEMIVRFIMSAVYSGMHNTSLTAAYVLCYLATNETWMAKVQAEIREVASRYSAPNASESLYDQLQRIPNRAWENEFPSLYLCVRETIRLVLLGCSFRWNTSASDVALSSGQIIPPGSFATYHWSDTHRNPDFYTDPTRWDPSRYLPDRAEDTRQPYAYIGWGAGRHPCLGKQFANGEINIVIATLLSALDFTLCKENGEVCDTITPINLNATTGQKPAEHMFLRTRPVSSM